MLESYLSKHNFVTLEKPADYIRNCLYSYEHRTIEKVPADQKRHIVANYYYLMNVLKQSALATIQAIGSIDALLREKSILADARALENKKINKLGIWIERLKSCDRSSASEWARLVEQTNHTLWYARRLEAAIDLHILRATTVGFDHREKVAKLRKQRDAIIDIGAPWLRSKAMEGLLKYRLKRFAEIRGLEEEFSLVGPDGTLLPPDQQKRVYHFSHPLTAQKQDLQVESRLKESMRQSREGLVLKMKKINEAVNFLHNNDPQMSEGRFINFIQEVPPFDLSIFREYYGSESYELRASSSRFESISEAINSLAQANRATLPTGLQSIAPALETEARLESDGRLLMALVDANILGEDSSLVTDYLAFMDAFFARKEARAGENALSGAECRADIRGTNQTLAEIDRTLMITAAITVGTMGVGAWAAVARTMATGDKLVKAGRATRMYASLTRNLASAHKITDGAALLGRYAIQAKILYGIMTAVDLGWLAEGVYISVAECHNLINERYPNFKIEREHLLVPQCRRDEGLATETALVADFRSCLVTSAMSIGLNLLPIVPGISAYRSVGTP